MVLTKHKSGLASNDHDGVPERSASTWNMCLQRKFVGPSSFAARRGTYLLNLSTTSMDSFKSVFALGMSLGSLADHMRLRVTLHRPNLTATSISSSYVSMAPPCTWEVRGSRMHAFHTDAPNGILHSRCRIRNLKSLCLFYVASHALGL